MSFSNHQFVMKRHLDFCRGTNLPWGPNCTYQKDNAHFYNFAIVDVNNFEISIWDLNSYILLFSYLQVLTSLWLFKVWIFNFVLEILHLFHWNTKAPFAKRIAFKTFALFYCHIILQLKKIYLITPTMCGTYFHNKKLIEIHASLNLFSCYWNSFQNYH